MMNLKKQPSVFQMWAPQSSSFSSQPERFGQQGGWRREEVLSSPGRRNLASSLEQSLAVWEKPCRSRTHRTDLQITEFIRIRFRSVMMEFVLSMKVVQVMVLMMSLHHFRLLSAQVSKEDFQTGDSFRLFRVLSSAAMLDANSFCENYFIVS